MGNGNINHDVIIIKVIDVEGKHESSCNIKRVDQGKGNMNHDVI